jgi:hypothetical protein
MIKLLTVKKHSNLLITSVKSFALQAQVTIRMDKPGPDVIELFR